MSKSHAFLHETHGGQGGDVGREGPGRRSSLTGQPEMGKEVPEVSGALRRRGSRGGRNRRGRGPGCKAGRVDWIVWEAGEWIAQEAHNRSPFALP